MFNERNQRIKEAGPSEPVLILGLNGAPAAGDTFHVIDTEQELSLIHIWIICCFGSTTIIVTPEFTRRRNDGSGLCASRF